MAVAQEANTTDLACPSPFPAPLPLPWALTLSQPSKNQKCSVRAVWSFPAPLLAKSGYREQLRGLVLLLARFLLSPRGRQTLVGSGQGWLLRWRGECLGLEEETRPCSQPLVEAGLGEARLVCFSQGGLFFKCERKRFKET